MLIVKRDNIKKKYIENYKSILKIHKFLMRNILYITDKYYKEMGGSYEAIGSTVCLKKDNFDIKFV